jgi:DNA-binding NarL/FixJ family response regulator
MKEPAKTPGKAPAIVIVDDDPVILDLLSRFCMNYGYTVAGTAENGEDAFAVIEKTHPDVVFIDIVLRGSMDGIELAQRINKKLKIPFVYVTGHSEPSLIERVIHTSPAAFILKPFKGEEIRVAVELIMRRRISR